MVILVYISVLFYISTIAAFFWGWLKIPVFQLQNNVQHVKVSVIVAFRNEANHLQQLLTSLQKQNYPHQLTEILLINDHSTDSSIDIIKQFQTDKIQVLTLNESSKGKKAALLLGMKQCTGSIILTTDADCILPPDWISVYVDFFSKNNSQMVVGPVNYRTPTKIAEQFQQLEFLSLQGATAGAIGINKPIMCNGANLGYSHEILPKVIVQLQNSTTPSGDDIFVLHHINKQYPGKVSFLKSSAALVKTGYSKNWTELFNQRKRWTSKAKFYTDSFTIFVAFVVLLINALILYHVFAALLFALWKPLVLLVLFKSGIDLPFLVTISGFYKSRKSLLWFPVVQSFYFLYVTITFVTALPGNYSWKLRKIST